MDASQYFQYRRGEVIVTFLCKLCTERKGLQYTGHFDIFKPAAVNASIELDTVNDSAICEELLSYMTPQRPVLVNYSLKSLEDSMVSTTILPYTI